MLLSHINSHRYLFINVLLIKLVTISFLVDVGLCSLPIFDWDWPMVSIFSWFLCKMFICGWLSKISHFVLSSQLPWGHGVTVVLFYVIASCRMIIEKHCSDNFRRNVWGWADTLKIFETNGKSIMLSHLLMAREFSLPTFEIIIIELRIIE